VKFLAITQHPFFKPAVGAALAVACGLVLWRSPLGERWVNASYDYTFRFGARRVTNDVVLVLMDNAAYGHHTNEVRGQPWSRALHTALLHRLADDGCALVVFDVFFRARREPAEDAALTQALRRQRRLVLMAEQAGVSHPTLASAGPVLPDETFLSAAQTNWGVAWLDPDLDFITRRHWPYPSPGPYPSLPWTAARLAGATLDESPRERWLRFYGREGPGESLSYHVALAKGSNYFRDKIVFIGNEPKTTVPDEELDEFRTPYTRWTGESSGGVEIMAAEFLNLLNGDWLSRPARWLEALVLVLAGAGLGGLLCRVRPRRAGGIAAGAALAVTLGSASLSYFSNYWFPWLIIAGGQVPCAWLWALVASRISYLPDAPDYELFNPPFGEGAYGRVWLARNAIGQWQALKAVYLSRFRHGSEPFERELRGIQRYKPVSDKHPGLLRVDFVSRRRLQGYFYYVMELGDAQTPGWQDNPASYQPRDLSSVRAQADRGRVPVRECVRIGLALSEALDFLHRQDLTHRDIKPSNIVFVNGRPKLADVGLVADVRPGGRESTWVGTPGYMPPPPEPPGTPQADIYGLGMVLYVISTGRDPVFFPVLSTSLIEANDTADFIHLNSIILKACQPDRAQRYPSAAAMHEALVAAQKFLGSD
jgi:CHASE2 domain-containing sensor protein